MSDQTVEEEIDEPGPLTVSPYDDIEVVDGVGVNDPDATELDPRIR